MTRGLVGCLLGLLFLAAMLAGGATGSPPPDAVDQRYPQATPTEFDTTIFRIQVYENRSARWTIVHTVPLANQSEIDAFETYATAFDTNRTALFGDFTARASTLVSYGENVTGRQMNATAFSREATVRQLGGIRGVVEMSFLWTNFARDRGDRVVVDDVFQGGMYIAPDQRLVFRTGPTVAFAEVRPPPDSLAAGGNLSGSTSITWFGEQQFADSRPSIELLPREAIAATTPTDPSTTTSSPSPTESPTATPVPANRTDPGMQLPMLVAGLVLAMAMGIGLAWYAGALSPSGPDNAGRDEPAPTSEPPAAGAASAVTIEDTPPAFRSDEDRVEQLLHDNGGRMKQVSIVEETDWSKSKVSMLLSEMEDEGRISKLRVGRENIISLAGEEPEAAGSPFEGE